MLVLLFVALWFIQRGDLLYVFPCVILLLCFSVLFVLRLPCLGKRELILVLFVRLFGLCLFRFVGFIFILGSGKGCGLWLWHSLDFSLNFFNTLHPPPPPPRRFILYLSFLGGGPGVGLTLCWFVFYATRPFVWYLILCRFVLVFFSPFSIAITSLGEERANLSAFRTFVRFVLLWICQFPLPLGVLEGLRFVIVALPGPFSYLFLLIRETLYAFFSISTDNRYNKSPFVNICCHLKFHFYI